MQNLYLHTLTCLLLWLHPDPRNVKRLAELTEVAQQVAVTDASDEEAELLVAVCVHETGCVDHAAWDGSPCFGPWQVCRPSESFDARAALRLLRWSQGACVLGDLSLYAGCGGCNRCAAIVASLIDPTLPRR